MNGFCNTWAMHLDGTWYGLLSTLTGNENMPSKQQIPLKTSLNSFCSCCVSFALGLLSASQFGPGKKKFILLLLVSMTIGLVLLLVLASLFV